MFPPCVVQDSAVSKTFQILYRNEEINIDGRASFRVHAIVETGKVRMKFSFIWEKILFIVICHSTLRNEAIS